MHESSTRPLIAHIELNPTKPQDYEDWEEWDPIIELPILRRNIVVLTATRAIAGNTDQIDDFLRRVAQSQANNKVMRSFQINQRRIVQNAKGFLPAACVDEIIDLDEFWRRRSSF
jgi:hypothetical protein